MSEKKDLRPPTQCMWDIVRISTPAIGACFVTKLQDTINVAMVGRLNDKAILSGVGLGNMMQAFIG